MITPNFSESREMGGPEVDGPSVDRNASRELQRALEALGLPVPVTLPLPETPALELDGLEGAPVNLDLGGGTPNTASGGEDDDERAL